MKIKKQTDEAEEVFTVTLRQAFLIWFKGQRSGKQEVKGRPGAIGEDQHPAAVEEAVLKLSGVARPVAEGQLTQAMTQTCHSKHTQLS